MRRFAVLALLVALAGCQRDGAGEELSAKAKARAVAPTVATYGKLVSVGEPKKRKECSEARPFVAGPCFDVVVTRDFPVVDKPGETSRIRTHVFLWLEREDGEWAVRHTAQWSPDIVVTVEYPEGTNSADVTVPAPWLYGGYVQEPPRGS